MSIEIQSVLEAIEETGTKAIVFGRSGSGKTVLCATTGQPTVILSAEKGLRSLKKYAMKHREAFKKIKVIQINSIDDLEEAFEMFSDPVERGESPICSWVCLDSISEIAEVILANAKKGSKDPRQAYGVMQERIAECARNFRDIPGYNVLFTCKQERITDDDTGKTMYRPMLPGKRLPQEIPYWFDEVYCLRVEQDTETKETYRVLQTDADYRYEAKSREGVLDQFEPPNIAAIMRKIDAEYEKIDAEFGGMISLNETVKDIGDVADEGKEEKSTDPEDTKGHPEIDPDVALDPEEEYEKEMAAKQQVEDKSEEKPARRKKAAKED